MLPFPCEEGKNLSEVSTFGIGGPARYFTEIQSKEEMQKAISYCHDKELPFFILGKGSNCLFDDRGYNGLVIQNRIDYLKHNEEGLFEVGAGYSFARLGGLTARQGWTGLEFASGIPATVGGAIFMNAGANGKETSHCLTHVEFVDEKGHMRSFSKQELHFSYRHSSFHHWKGAIVSGIFMLAKSTLAKATQKEILNYRLKTQPYGEKSAGCAFKNPPGNAAGRLIEECGLKGITVGDAKISPLHGNFIVNQGTAKTQDVVQLVQKVKETIFEKTGILLEEEIRIVPYQQ